MYPMAGGEVVEPGVDGDPLRPAQALHRPAQAEGVGADQLDRTDVELAAPRGRQAVGPEARLAAAQAGQRDPDGVISQPLLDDLGGQHATGEVGGLDHRDGRGAFLHPGRLDLPLDPQAGAAQDVEAGAGDEDHQADAEDDHRRPGRQPTDNRQGDADDGCADAEGGHRTRVRGTGTACRARATTSSAVRPWTSASGLRITRWASVDCARALTSSGVT